MQRATLIGSLEVITAQIVVGANITIVKSLVHSIPIFLLLEIRFLIGTFILLGLNTFYGQQVYLTAEGAPFDFKQWRLLFAQAACGGFLFNILIFTGLHYTTATAAGIITSTVPIFISLFAYLLLKEKLAKNKMTAIIIAVVGLTIMSVGKGQYHTDNAQMSLFGNAIVLLAMLPEALFTIFAKMQNFQVKPLVLAFLANCFNTLLFMPFALALLWQYSLSDITASQWQLLVLYTLLGSVLFFTLSYKGLAKISASTAALFTSIMPISATACAFFFLHEAIHWFDLAGMACVIFSIVVGSDLIKRNLEN